MCREGAQGGLRLCRSGGRAHLLCPGLAEHVPPRRVQDRVTRWSTRPVPGNRGGPGGEEALPPTLHTYPPGPGLQNAASALGSLKANGATMGQLNNVQNKEGHRPHRGTNSSCEGRGQGQRPAQLWTGTQGPPRLLGLDPDLKAARLGFPQETLPFLISLVDVGAAEWLWHGLSRLLHHRPRPPQRGRGRDPESNSFQQREGHPGSSRPSRRAGLAHLRTCSKSVAPSLC